MSGHGTFGGFSSRSSLNPFQEALDAQFKKRKEQELERRRSAAAISIKRCSVQIRSTGLNAAVTHGQFYTCDLGAKILRLTSERPLYPEEVVAVTLDGNQRFYVKGRVRWCKHYNLSPRVKGPMHFTYRVELELFFENEQEKVAVRDYWAELTSRHGPKAHA